MTLKVSLLIKCFIITLIFIFSFSSAVATTTTTTGSINWWCTQTPHYQTCSHYVADHNISSATISAKEFLDITVKAAIDEARVVLKRSQKIESKYPYNARGKSSWRNCVEYFDGIVFTLNEVLDHRLKPTPHNIQTWLSAGLTYITMCENEFKLINMTNNILPTISVNLKELLLNSLAISVVIRRASTNNIIPNGGLVNQNISNKNTLSTYLAQDEPDVVVAQDGSGDFNTIQEAVNSADSRRRSDRFVIYVKAGTYNEQVIIPKEVQYITMYGDGINQTIVSGDRNLGANNLRTMSSQYLQDTATFLWFIWIAEVWSRGFMARDMTFRNTAGSELHQAVALLSGSDQSVVYRCSIEGYQDTLYTTQYTQFYKDCKIFGTVDFIFGDAQAVFQDCDIFVRKPYPHGGLVVTSHGRTFENESTGYSLQGCKIVAGDDLKPIIGQIKPSFLGRPWRPYARTIFMQSFLDDIIDPQGWLDDQGYYETLYYGEYQNNGPGSSTDNRVNWPGYHIIVDQDTANEYTVANFISGNDWLPATGVPFTPGLY
uniref:pectinesterase-like n=1 Tax=Erigeron canadensis TaxID=72917 RepID=UPI001CB8D171|nr:pectinesterase-like [Erigeron canadensis]